MTDTATDSQTDNPTRVKCASNSMRAGAGVVPGAGDVTSASAAGGPRASTPARSASLPPSPSPVQVLRIEYWSHFLPLVVDKDRADSIISDIVEGVSIGRPPAQGVIESRNWPSALEFREKVSEVIQGDLDADKLYGPFSSPPFPRYIVSPLGAFLKRDRSKIRLIHDLSFPKVGSVNSEIDPEQFSLEYSSVDEAVRACRSHSFPFMSKIDLKDAYKAIGIRVADWHLMGFKWSLDGGPDSYFFSKVLSFGLRSAPALFDRFADILVLFMQFQGVQGNIIRYVDDFLLVSKSRAEADSQLAAMISVARQAGFCIQESKITPPSRCVEFLGVIIDLDSSELRISQERIDEVRGLLAQWGGSRVVSKRRILKLVGKLAFAARVVRTGRAFLGRLIGLSKSASALHHRVRISQAARRDLEWWRDCLASHNGTCILEVDWSHGDIRHIFTDASNYGFGCVMDEEWIAIAYQGGNSFPGGFSINWRELHAAVKALATWGPSLRGSKVLFHIDNSTTCHVLNKLYSPVSELMELIRAWCILIERFSITVAVVYIPTDENVLADALSRGDLDGFFRSLGGRGRRVWPESFLYFDSLV